MEPTWKHLAIAVAASLGIASCARGDYASISITYPAQKPAVGDPWPRADIAVSQRISQSFLKAAEGQGYKCRAHVKRVEEITCRGPKDMYVTFKPTLNQPEFVAAFNWVELGDRTHDEFRAHIERFCASMISAVDDKTVRVAIAQPAAPAGATTQ